MKPSNILQFPQPESWVEPLEGEQKLDWNSGYASAAVAAATLAAANCDALPKLWTSLWKCSPSDVTEKSQRKSTRQD